MSLSESIYTIPAAESHEASAAQFGNFLENVLGLTVKNDYTYTGTKTTATGTIYWLDEKKTVGFAAVYLSGTYNHNGIIPYYAGRAIEATGTTASSITDGLRSSYDSDVKIYYQTGKNGDVIYFRIGTEAKCKFIAAKDTAKSWYILQNYNLFYQGGWVAITVGVDTNSKVLFSAAKMPTIIADSTFLNLYRMISATSFVEANTYVSFKNQPYKVVTLTASSSSLLPCFAFPVAE